MPPSPDAAQAVDLGGDAPHPAAGAHFLEGEAARRRHGERDLAAGEAQAVVARLADGGHGRGLAAPDRHRPDAAILQRQFGRRVGLDRQVRQGDARIDPRGDERRQVRTVLRSVQGLEDPAQRFHPHLLLPAHGIDPVNGEARLAGPGPYRLLVHCVESRKATVASPSSRPCKACSPAPAREAKSRRPSGLSTGQDSRARLQAMVRTEPSPSRQRATAPARPTAWAAMDVAPSRRGIRTAARNANSSL